LCKLESHRPFNPSSAMKKQIACLLAFFLALAAFPHEARAAMSFCNRTSVAIEAALGYRGETQKKPDDWISEGWWRIEPGQCARVYTDPLTSRFYFYFAHAMAEATKGAQPTVWSGKFTFCTDTKAFRIEGADNCLTRGYMSRGFEELDIGAPQRDYTLDFRDGSSK